MRTILVDDEKWNLVQMKQEMDGFSQIKFVGAFEDPREALSYAKENLVEFAILDVEMPFMNGIELGRKLRAVNPDIILIYLTGYEQYIKDAILDLKADYYLLKPYTSQDIKEIVKRAIALSGRLKKRVQVKTFGVFEVYIDGELIHFANRKAKELLALCIHMEGAHVTLENAVDTLWEDHPFDNGVKSLYRKAVIYLNGIFRDHDMEEVFENGRGYCCVNPQNVDCDYYEYLAGQKEIDVMNEKMSYLPMYSWAEGTIPFSC